MAVETSTVAGQQAALRSGFVFATGLECSAPVVGGGVRMDQLRKTGHYGRVAADVAMVAELGVTHLRCGIPFHIANRAPGCFDWSYADEVLAACDAYGVTPMVDLVHFGVPDDLTGFDDPALAMRVAGYATAFARRHPAVRNYTVVNEPLITSAFSALYGFWNERRTGDRSFTRTLLNVARATVAGMNAVRAETSDAVFLCSDSCEAYHPIDVRAIERADLLNDLRFAAYELIFGRPLGELTARFLVENGAETDELRWFEAHGSSAGCVVGNDYYAACEKEVLADGSFRECGERAGYYRLAHDYYHRLRLPFMAAETNSAEGDPQEWLARQWTDVTRLQRDGLPIMGFTWYGFINHVDWDTLLTEDNGRENLLGLVSLDRSPMPVYAAFRKLIAEA